MGMKIPKVMIAAVKSGSGKTTITCAFLKQLLCRKKHPVSFKCGPDYIDPMFHEQVLKIPSKNLDTFFSDVSQIQALYEMELPGHDIAVLEGVMGLYDGLGGIPCLVHVAHEEGGVDQRAFAVEMRGGLLGRDDAARGQYGRYQIGIACVHQRFDRGVIRFRDEPAFVFHAVTSDLYGKSAADTNSI